MTGDFSKEGITEQIANVLKNDGSFTESALEQRAQEIVGELSEKDRVEFSPSRYGIVRSEQDKTMISIYKKGHNFYTDKIIEEIDISALRM